MNGRDLGHAGALRAAKHADWVEASWQAKAHGLLMRFLGGSGSFQCQHVINYAKHHDFPAPPDDRAWGMVMLRAARQGIIYKVGYEPSISLRQHGRPCAVWRKA